MRVVFFDKKAETYCSVENVIQLDSIMLKSNGRYTYFWHIIRADGTIKSFKQKDYSIHRVMN